MPAKSLEVDHRIGYVRAGYDADIVVYDSHPLSLGATPLQVYIDGRATLDPEKVAEILSDRLPESRQDQEKPKMRPSIREETYRQIAEGKTIITGITKSFVPIDNPTPSPEVNLTMVLDNGKVICFNTPETCLPHTAGGTIVQLEDGHVLPGLTAAFTDLGLSEIAMEGDTGDGSPNHDLNSLDPENVVYAKYGVHMQGRGFERARMGGVTRVLSLPAGEGFLRGVSTGIKTSGKSILDGGVFQDDVALHFTVGQGAKGASHSNSAPEYPNSPQPPHPPPRSPAPYPPSVISSAKTSKKTTSTRAPRTALSQSSSTSKMKYLPPFSPPPTN